jgi:NAD(P)H-nitrite reductase large subunit
MYSTGHNNQRLLEPPMQFVIVGNGIAGISAASAIRELRPDAAITMVSEEPHCSYSACVLSYYVSGEIDRQRVFLKQMSDYSGEGIRLTLAQRVTAINSPDKKIVLDSDIIPYDKLIVATGSRPAVPPIRGIDKEGVFAFKTLDEADSIVQWGGNSAVIIGSGPVGLEIAFSLRKIGYQVFLIEFLNRVLPRIFDDYPSSAIKSILEDNGVQIFTGERVEEIHGGVRVEGVSTDRRYIPCDTVVLASGMKPQVSLVRGTLELGRLGGIRVDDNMRTSVPDIYACGDCIQTKDLLNGSDTLAMLWLNARQQGEVAGYNAAGYECHYPGALSITGVELPGTRAFSLGSLASEPGDEVIEKKHAQNYLRLVLRRGLLIGVQTIGGDEHIGRWLSLLLRQEEVRNPKTLIACRYAARRVASFRVPAHAPAFKQDNQPVGVNGKGGIF